MDEGFRIWANPSSPHTEGRKAKAALEANPSPTQTQQINQLLSQIGS